MRCDALYATRWINAVFCETRRRICDKNYRVNTTKTRKVKKRRKKEMKRKDKEGWALGGGEEKGKWREA
jgi:hypothetical protein